MNPKISTPEPLQRAIAAAAPPAVLPLALLALALLGPLSAAAVRAETPIRARYLCKGRFDASVVTALFFNRAPSEVILLEGSEGATRLQQLPAASGARYGDGDAIFWIKGDQATWQRSKAVTLQCSTD